MNLKWWKIFGFPDRKIFIFIHNNIHYTKVLQ
jgi:hypothetical protein